MKLKTNEYTRGKRKKEMKVRRNGDISKNGIRVPFLTDLLVSFFIVVPRDKRLSGES